MKTYVLYHANCPDGFTCAWVAHGVLKDQAEYLPVFYGQDPPLMDEGSTVYILDFCYKRPVLLSLCDRMNKVVVLDHHKTAMQDLRVPDLKKEVKQRVDFSCEFEFTFNMNKSGGHLTWEWFHPEEDVPMLVRYTEDRDLWLWKMPDSRAVNAYIQSFPFSFSIWDDISRRVAGGVSLSLLQAIDEGNAILRYQKRHIDSQVKNAREVEIGGHRVLCVNATILHSEIAGELAVGRPFGVCYFDRQDGKRVYSLRSAPDGLDVSEVAKSLGGGGHKHAAGFEKTMDSCLAVVP